MTSYQVLQDLEANGQFQLDSDNFPGWDYHIDLNSYNFLQSCEFFDTASNGNVPFGSGENTLHDGQFVNGIFDLSASTDVYHSQHVDIPGMHAYNNTRPQIEPTQSRMSSFMTNMHPSSSPDMGLDMNTLDTTFCTSQESPTSILQTSSQQQSPKTDISTPRT
jgi:hypothetical protein